MPNQKEVDSARTSLKRVQDFDAALLARAERLGETFHFKDAVEPAERLIRLFRQFPDQYLDDLSDSQLSNIKNSADATFNVFDQIANFDPKTNDAYNVRQSLLNSVQSHYEGAFNTIFPLIAYAGSRLKDFTAIEAQARAAVQAAKDQADQTAAQLKAHEGEAQRILDDVRRMAAEQGVSQQSIYFRNESEQHETAAETWQWRTIWLAVGLVVYVAISIFFHKWNVLAPTNTYEAVQLTTSKVLIFAVIAFMLVLSARNFLASKHNAIVNRHRYNALLTFNALVDAASKPENRDIVLNYAASCIYAPQETGFSKGASERTEIIPNIIQTLPKLSGTSS